MRPETRTPIPESGDTVTSQHADVELLLPAEPESVGLARQMVRGILDSLGWSEESRTDISIAVTEACTNSVLHAYPDGEVDGGFEVHAWVGPERLVVAVRDKGRGISPKAPSAAAGLGLGLPLILAICDEVAFTSEEGVTEVRMTFSSTSRQATP